MKISYLKILKERSDVYYVMYVYMCVYKLYHDKEVGMGFTQPRAKGPRIV